MGPRWGAAWLCGRSASHEYVHTKRVHEFSPGILVSHARFQRQFLEVTDPGRQQPRSSSATREGPRPQNSARQRRLSFPGHPPALPPQLAGWPAPTNASSR
ncbi:hypothetical protein T484DRAFT_1972300 [Baffinella frigidus]|nr:hypothetical protein T484DRAFT_1972300 [Cryptophyta sp. CCMP2293]